MQLTKHHPGSMREVWTLSMPLMFACLSSYMMWFIDRFFLTYFSLEALNATVTASALAWGFLGGTAVMAGMIELFVAQYNGASQPEKIGQSIWQMIWFSLATSIVFIPIGMWGSSFFYEPGSMESSYFRWTMCFGCLHPFIYTLTSFFVGRGHIKGVVCLALLSTLFYGVIDKILIFGIPGLIPEMGVTGAALAGCITLSIQSLILFSTFLRRKNRALYGTRQWQFDLNSFIKKAKVTGPPAILYNIEQLGWGLFYSLMFMASPIHITISSLCQSLILLFSFFGDGLARGSAVLANNYVGSGNSYLVYKVWTASKRILVIIFSCQIFLLLLMPRFFIKSFLPTAHTMDLFGESLETSLWFVLIALLFQGCQWVLSGLLYAKGESFFVMFTGSLSIWLFLLLPSYVFIVKQGHSVLWAWIFVAFYGFMCTAIYLWRLRAHSLKTVEPVGSLSS
jgi:MATE family multidrug resistance protein